MLPKSIVDEYWWQELPQEPDKWSPSPIFCGGTCQVCSIVGARDILGHCKSTRHVERVTELIKIQRDSLSQFHKLLPLLVVAQKEEQKISKLLWEPWKNVLRGQLFPYHQWDIKSGSFPSSLPSIDDSLRKFLYKERIALLQLAVWKFHILFNYFTDNGPIAALEFFGGGWKIHKEDAPLKTTSAVAIVVTHVMAFIEKP